MRLAQFLKDFLPTLIAVPVKTVEKRAEAVTRSIVRSYSRGNLNLQCGRYLTARQLEARKIKLVSHEF